MARKSKIILLVPIALLLARNFIPAALGQIIQTEWSRNPDLNLYRPTINSLAGDGSLPNYRSQYYISNPDFDAGSGALPGPSPRQKPVKVRPQPPSNAYPLFERFFPASSFHGLANVQGVDVGDLVSSKSFQQPKKRQNVEEVMDGSVPQIDYTLEDDSVPPHDRPASKLEDYTLTPPSPKAKTKIKATSPDGLSRYFIFSNLKRARDGYICHFKLCQVGVSGKRLSNN